MKIFKPLKNKKGFTMIELTVTMVILVIAMGLAATLIISSGGFLAKDSEMNAAKYIGDGVYSWVENRVRYASDITLCKPGSELANNYKCVYVAGDGDTSGHLVFADFGAQPVDVFGSQFYLGNTVKLYASENPEDPKAVDLLDLRVEVLDGDNNVIYSAASTIKLVNISLKNNEIKTESDAGATPLLCFVNDAGSAGGYSDPNISRLAAVCEPLKDAINGLLADGRTDQIKALLGSSPPTNNSLRQIAYNDLGDWPDIKKTVGDAANCQFAEPYFMMNADGSIKGIVYYGTNSSNNKAFAVYNTNKDAWYIEKGGMSIDEFKKYDSYEKLLSYIEQNWDKENSN